MAARFVTPSNIFLSISRFKNKEVRRWPSMKLQDASAITKLLVNIFRNHL